VGSSLSKASRAPEVPGFDEVAPQTLDNSDLTSAQVPLANKDIAKDIKAAEDVAD
jgi:hypothetical protein